MRVLTIFIRFGLDQYASAETNVDAFFARQLPRIERRVLVVDNAIPPGVIEDSGSHTVIGGDNRYREFSALDRAIAFVGDDLRHYDLVHVATSAFNTLYVAYLERFDEAILRRAATNPVCLGHIDCYNEPVGILGFRSQHWIRTGFFFLPPIEAQLLGSFVSIDDSARFFSGDPAAPFRADAPISDNYRRYIIDWLTGDDIGQGVTWHSHFDLTADTLPAFEHKTVSILNEHLLAARLRAAGCRVVDVTWATSEIARGRDPRWNEPWQTQLANRDRDALVDV